MCGDQDFATEAQQLAGHILRRGLCLRFAPVALTDCAVNEARQLFSAANQQRLTPFMRGVQNTDLSNGRILGQMSRPSAYVSRIHRETPGI